MRAGLVALAVVVVLVVGVVVWAIGVQNRLSGALSRLLVTVERYPELKSNQNFLTLQSQLEGTENRITVERQRYNTAVRDYNTRLRTFPASVVAGMMGFKPKAFFEAAPGSETAPKVKF